MRALYLPTSGRVASTTSRILDLALQDNVRTDRHSRNHTYPNSLVVELESAAALDSLLDARPWAADVRFPGSIVRAIDEDIDFVDYIYSVPKKWEIVPQSEYTYIPETVPFTITRAIETTEGLLFQTDENLVYKLDSTGEFTQVFLSDIGIYGSDTEQWCLASLTSDTYDIYRGGETALVEIAATIKGFDIVIADRGVFDVELSFSARANIETGDDVSALDYFVEAGKAYNSAGDQVPYTITNDIITLASGTEALLHYTAKWTKRVKTPPQGLNISAYDIAPLSVNFSEISSFLYKLPDSSQVTVYKVQDVIGRVPGSGPLGLINVDSKGYVSNTAVNHPIEHVLASEFHTVVGGSVGDTYRISLIEHDINTVVLKQTFDLDIIGISFSADDTLNIIAQTEDSFISYQLVDIRPSQNPNSGPLFTQEASVSN